MVRIGLIGKKGSGKNTFADYFISKKKDFKQIAFADPLKNGLIQMYGFSHDQLFGNKKEEVDEFWGVSPRKVMQFIGTDVFREIDPDFWVKRTIREMKSDVDYICSDVRFQNEADCFDIIVKIARKEENVDLHISENSDLPCDIVVENTGTLSELYEKIDTLINIIDSPYFHGYSRKVSI